MTPDTSDRPSRGDDDDRLNELFQTVLREAANEREGRAQILLEQDLVAARRESDALLDLARGRSSGS